MQLDSASIIATTVGLTLSGVFTYFWWSLYKLHGKADKAHELATKALNDVKLYEAQAADLKREIAGLRDDVKAMASRMIESADQQERSIKEIMFHLMNTNNGLKK